MHQVIERIYHIDSVESTKIEPFLEDKECVGKLIEFVVNHIRETKDAVFGLLSAFFGEVSSVEEYLALNRVFSGDKFKKVFPVFCQKHVEDLKKHAIELTDIDNLGELIQTRINAFIKEYEIYKYYNDSAEFNDRYGTILRSEEYGTIIGARDGGELYIYYNEIMYSSEYHINDSDSNVRFFLFATADFNIVFDIQNNRITKIEGSFVSYITNGDYTGIISVDSEYEIFTVLENGHTTKKKKMQSGDKTVYTFLDIYSGGRHGPVLQHVTIERKYAQRNPTNKLEVARNGEIISPMYIQTKVFENLTVTHTGEELYQTQGNIIHYVSGDERDYVIESVTYQDLTSKNGESEVIRIVNIDDYVVEFSFRSNTEHKIYGSKNNAVIVFEQEGSTTIYDTNSGVCYMHISKLTVHKHEGEYSFEFIDGQGKEVKFFTRFSSLSIEYDNKGLEDGIKIRNKGLH